VELFTAPAAVLPVVVAVVLFGTNDPFFLVPRNEGIIVTSDMRYVISYSLYIHTKASKLLVRV
jgi:hypothetical protein